MGDQSYCCYCSTIQLYKNEINTIKAAMQKIDAANTILWNELPTRAARFASVFAASSSPNNLGAVVDRINTCYDAPKAALLAEYETLETAVKNLGKKINEMTRADDAYHRAENAKTESGKKQNG